MSKFKVGDVVQLNSGGPAMTVKADISNESQGHDEGINQENCEKVRCTWFINTNVSNNKVLYDGPYENDFTENQLTLVDIVK